MGIQKLMLRALLIAAALTLSVSPTAATRGDEDEHTPLVVQAIPPVYPSIARAAGVSGEIIAEVSIDSRGSVTSVSILRGHRLLNREVEKAASRWKFSPLERAKKERRVRLSFQFTLSSAYKATPEDHGIIFWPPYRVEIKDMPYRVD